MRFELHDFQAGAADTVIKGLRRGIRDYNQDRDYTAQSLAAPTGAGKTVIATAVIERLLFGDNEAAPDALATVLWVTDDPSLNEQTRRKMLAASSVLGDGHLVTLREGFHAERLDPGRVYFVNIQKLGAKSHLMRRSDMRRYTLYDTFSNTIEAIGAHFIVMLDEAHRGLRAAVKDAERRTLVSRFLTGYGNDLRIAPVVLGISATPERFNAFLGSGSSPHSIRRCEISTDDVRASGLLKDTLFIKHPGEDQPGDVTIARLAAEDFRAFQAAWAEHARLAGQPEAVYPVLVVQVRDKRGGGGSSGSDTNLGEVLRVIQSVLPKVGGKALAHSFGTHTALEIGSEAVRYIAPEDIEDDPDVQVVFFKEALTTGWDCPRAEVMLSYRPARESTYIAQLIGRMVRTPLTRRVGNNELLNSVSLYLPHYDKRSVEEVIARLKSDPDRVPPIDIATNATICTRNPSLPPTLFDILGTLPNYVIPSASRRSQVARLNALGALLAGDGIDQEALRTSTSLLLSTLDARRALLDAEGLLQPRLSELSVLDIETQGVDALTGRLTGSSADTAPLEAGNVEDLLRQASRLLRDGLARVYWAHRVFSGKLDPLDAKIETFALASVPEVVAAVEDDAQAQVQALLHKHDAVIRGLPDERRQRYYLIQQQARHPELTPLTVFDAITASADDPIWDKHLYCDADGHYPTKLNTWESAVLAREVNDAVGWYRNTGGRRAVAVPYQDGPRWKPLFPDFVFFHRVDGKIRASIVDPHGYHLRDAASKLQGYASYAQKHADAYHRMDAVTQLSDGRLLRLDMKNPNVRASVTSLNGHLSVESLFEMYGTVYG